VKKLLIVFALLISERARKARRVLAAALMFSVLLTLATAAKLPVDGIDAHRRADGILYPLLTAAMNEFALDHGGPNDPGHFDKLRTQDIEHIRAVRETFKAWDQAMKQAGY
jgi:hypothetical protein